MSDDIHESILNAPEVPLIEDNGDHGSKPPSKSSKQPAPCPVVPLGHFEGKFYMLDAIGQLRSLSARQLDNRAELMSLFMDEGAYMKDRWPHYKFDKQTGEAEIVDFARKNVSDWLMAECRKAGMYGEHIILRKPGIWAMNIGKQRNRPIVHCGDMVLIEGQEKAPGLRIGNQIWGAAPPQPRPGLPAPFTVGELLNCYLRDNWNFAKPAAHCAIVGWLGCAYLGQAINWRPAMFIMGDAGSGKSSLMDFIKYLCPVAFHVNDATKAGLEQSLDGRAIPVIIDEASDNSRAKSGEMMLDMVLTASGESGTIGRRGSADGVARSIGISGSVIMAGINPPDMQAQHIGRFTLIELKRPDADSDRHYDHKALKDWALEYGAALWGRALENWENWQEARSLFRDGLDKEKSCDPREKDQITAILAGWWIITHDGLPDQRGVLEGITALEQFIKDTEEMNQYRATSQMMTHLLTQLVMVQRSTERRSIANLIDRVLEKNAQDSGEMILERTAASEVLAQYGIRVIRPSEIKDIRGRSVPREADGLGIWFWPACAPLKALFKDTPFNGQKLGFELRRLESARERKKPMKIGSSTARNCIWVSGEELGFGEEADNV